MTISQPDTADAPLEPDVAQMTSEVVGLHRRAIGRGPTRARTRLVDDVAVVVLEDVYTSAERRLIAAAKADAVRMARTALHETLRDEIVSVVETRLGRRVRAHLSAAHLDPDMVLETFVLDPPVRS